MPDIDIKVGASGVSQFKQQMNQAAGAVKGINAELKLAEAQYQATGDQQQYLAEKSELLKKQLEEQKKSVAAAEKALAAVEKQYGKNSTQANAWRTKLVQAKTALVQTETAIHKTDSALDALAQDDVSGVARDLGQVEQKAKDADSATDGLGETLSHVSTKLDIETIKNGIDSITKGVEGVIQKAAQMGKALWTAATDAADWADSTRDAATAAHMSTTEYQQLSYAAQFFGTSIDSLTKTQGRLSKAMANADGEVLQVGDSLVNTMTWVEDGMGGYIRQKRKWSDVLLDTIDALGEIEDPAERDAAAMEMFGKSYSELSGIVEGGTDAFRKRMNEAPVVSEETVDNLADTADAVKDMNSRLETLKLEVLNALSPTITEIANAVSSLAKSLTEFLQTEEGQQMMKDLAQSIKDIVDAFTGEVDFAGIVTTAKDALNKLNGAFKWLSQNKDSIVKAIEAIAISIGLLKLGSIGLSLTNSLLSLKNLLNNGGGAAAGGGGAAASGAGAGAGGSAAASGGVVAAGLGQGLTYGGIVIGGLTGEALLNRIHLDAVKDIDFAKLKKKADELGQTLPFTEEDVASLQASANSGVFDWQTRLDTKMGAKEFVGENWADMRKYTKDFQFWQDFANELGMTFDDFMNMTPDSAEFARADEKIKAWTKWDPNLSWDEQVEGAEAWGDSFGTFKEQAASAMAEYIEAYSQMYTDAEDGASTGGAATGTAFADALAATEPAVRAAAATLAAAATETLNSVFAALNRSTGSSGGAGGGTYNANSNMYIGTYNQNSGGDATVLAATVSAAQRKLRRGFGARQ